MKKSIPLLLAAAAGLYLLSRKSPTDGVVVSNPLPADETLPPVSSPYQPGVSISPVDLPVAGPPGTQFSAGQLVYVDGNPGVITSFTERNSLGEEYNVLMANNLGEFKWATHVTTYTNRIQVR